MATDFIAGCIGGGAGVIVGHPLDTVKVRLQTQSVHNIRYTGTFHALFTIAKQESVAGLYRGITSPLYGVSLMNALVFGVYGCLQPFVIGNPGNNATWAHALAGSMAGATQSIVCSPMELVKIRMQLNESSGKQPSSFVVLQRIYEAHGLRAGVFKGFFITLMREIPGFGTYFGSYELFTQVLETHKLLTSTDGQIGTLGMMMCGGSAGVTSWLACFPMDVIKTRFQSDINGRYNGVWDCAKKTYQSEGYNVFTRTLPSLLIRAFPMNAITFPIVTWIIRLSERHKVKSGTAREEINAILSETTNVAANEIYRKIYNTPPYHMLTPRIPTVICSETQNLFNISTRDANYKKTATICPCCALAEVHGLTPLLYNDEMSAPKIQSTEDEVTTKIDSARVTCSDTTTFQQEKISEESEDTMTKETEKLSILKRILQAFSFSSSDKPKRKCSCKNTTNSMEPIE